VLIFPDWGSGLCLLIRSLAFTPVDPMTRLQRIAVLVLTSLLLLARAAAGSDNPSLQVTVRQPSAEVPAGLVVEASDSEGLDSLDITCRQADSTYHTQLSRSAADRRFRRSFSLTELFPFSAESKEPVRLEISIRNTRGATASTVVLIQHINTDKGK